MSTTLEARQQGHVYPVLVGPSARRLADFTEGRDRVALVTCARVLATPHGSRIAAALARTAPLATTVVLPDGERGKTLAVLERSATALLHAGLTRRSLVVALGGGAVTDAAGFLAAVFMRGVDWLAVPTTVLAMVDAALGGQDRGQPAARQERGRRLPPAGGRPLRPGLARAPCRRASSGAAWARCSSTGCSARSSCPGSPHAPGPGRVDERTLADCARVKLEVVERDPREQGERKLLNLGHTFGHGVEAAGGFRRWTHGESVAVGMAFAFRLARIARAGGRRGSGEGGGDALTGAGLPVRVAPSAARKAMTADGPRQEAVLDGAALGAADSPRPRLGGRVGRRRRPCRGPGGGAGDRETGMILLVNGPNLNLLGRARARGLRVHHAPRHREDGDRGLRRLRARGAGLPVEPRGRRSSTSSRSTARTARGLIVNPGAFTHTSYALHDCLKSVSFPVVEVHISNVHAREEWRRQDLIAPATPRADRRARAAPATTTPRSGSAAQATDPVLGEYDADAEPGRGLDPNDVRPTSRRRSSAATTRGSERPGAPRSPSSSRRATRPGTVRAAAVSILRQALPRSRARGRGRRLARRDGGDPGRVWPVATAARPGGPRPGGGDRPRAEPRRWPPATPTWWSAWTPTTWPTRAGSSSRSRRSTPIRRWPRSARGSGSSRGARWPAAWPATPPG